MEIGGVLAKAHYLVIDLPHSDDSYVRAFPAETTEAFLEEHAEAFRYWGGVPRRILYDNTTLAVARILGDGTRLKTRAFSGLQSHYWFEERLGRPGKGNDKGKVENLVKVARRSFFVPRPRFPSWEALNLWLQQQCRKRRERRQRGHRETIAERFERDRGALLPLPAVAYEAFEFPSLPSLNKSLVLELARSEYLDRRENVLALGNSGTGKTHLALALGLAACQKGYRVRFTTAAALVHELLEAGDDQRLLRLQKQLAKQDLLIVDELGYVPLSTGSELLFEIFSQRYERASTLVTSNLPFHEWTEIFGSERLTGALLDRLTHHVHILEMNGESYRLQQSKASRKCSSSA